MSSSYGKTFVVSSSSAGAGGAEYGELAPAAGVEYDVYECVGYHDDNAAARDTFWTFSDGTTVLYRSTNNIAQLLRQDYMSTVVGTSVIGNSHKANVLTLHHGQYIRFNVSALGAGKKAYLQAIVRVRRGLPEWA